MCIRDRALRALELDEEEMTEWISVMFYRALFLENPPPERCLLYTSDAADERSSVDLGGRRIIKKKHDEDQGRARTPQYETQQ